MTAPDRPEDPAESVPVSSFFVHDGHDAAPGSAAQAGQPRWRILGELGAGGMGRVHLAWDAWLEREVAIKEPRSPEATAALEREVRLTATLEHPGIVAVHDVIIAPTGVPWFVMPVVRGRSLAQALAETTTTGARLALVRNLLAVAETVAFAHARGVIHGDLKPENVLLDHFGQTRVIDWGLATRVDMPGPRRRGGSVQWMSPEQARGEAPNPADDVFAIGAILHATLAGTHIRAHIRDADGAAKQHAPDLSQLTADLPDVPVDLLAIMGRALSPARALRYSDAGALADDLRRFLDGRLVNAHRYTLRQRVWRFVRRWRAPLGVGLIAALAFGIFGIVAAHRMSAIESDARSSHGRALVLGGEAALRRGNGEEAAMMAARAMALDQDPTPAARGLHLASAPSGVVALPAPPPSPCPRDAAIADNGHTTLCGDEGGRVVHAYRDGRHAWSGDIDFRRGLVSIGAETFAAAGIQTITLIRAHDGHVLRHESRMCSNRLGVTAHGTAAWMQRPTCVVLITPERTIEMVTTACPDAHATAFAAHRDLDTVALACETGEIVMGSLARGTFERFDAHLKPPGLGVASMAFSADASRLIVGTQQGWLISLSTTTGERVQKLSLGGYIEAITPSPDGRIAIIDQHVDAPLVLDVDALSALDRLPRATRHASWGSAGELVTFDTARGTWHTEHTRPREVAVSHGVTALAVSHDGGTLAVGQDQWLTIVDTATRRPIARHRWQHDVIKSVHFMPDGSLVAHGIGEPATRIMSRPRDANALEAATRVGHPIARRVVKLDTGALLASTWADGTARLDPATGASVVLGPFTIDLRVGGDGATAFGLEADGRVWRATNPRATQHLATCGIVAGATALATGGEASSPLALLPDGIVSACGGNEYYSVTGAGDAQPAPLTAIGSVGEWRIAGARDGTVWFWRAGHPSPVAAYRGHDGRVSSIAADPNGRWVATGGWDTRVRFWDLDRL